MAEMIDSKTDLKPCPFCGRSPNLDANYAYCNFCGGSRWKTEKFEEMTTENKAPKTAENDIEKARKIVFVYWQHLHGKSRLQKLFTQALAEQKLETLKMKEIKELADAARGIRFGEDWNNGTHAKLHGYREKLIEASKNFDALIEKLEGK